MIGTHMMTERRRRDEVVVRLERPGRTVVALTSMQIANFAGNALELQGRDGRRILALSTISSLSVLCESAVITLNSITFLCVSESERPTQSRRHASIFATAAHASFRLAVLLPGAALHRSPGRFREAGEVLLSGGPGRLVASAHDHIGGVVGPSDRHPDGRRRAPGTRLRCAANARPRTRARPEPYGRGAAPKRPAATPPAVPSSALRTDAPARAPDHQLMRTERAHNLAATQLLEPPRPRHHREISRTMHDDDLAARRARWSRRHDPGSAVPERPADRAHASARPSPHRHAASRVDASARRPTSASRRRRRPRTRPRS